MSTGGTSERAPRSLAEAENHSWVDHAVRVGMVAYGAVYLLVGWLALQLALGQGSGETSAGGAMTELAQQPFGQVALWLVALGMLLLVAWRLLEAVAGHRSEDGSDRVRKQVVSVLKAVIYAAVGLSAVQVVTGSGSTGGSDGTDGPTAQVLQLPGGQLIVGAVALGILGYAVVQAKQAVTEDFLKHLSAEGKRGTTGKVYVWAGKIGYAAKAVAVAIIGGLFAYAAITHNASKSGGMDQALQQVLEQPYGRYLLGVVAIGIAGYGVFCLARARHLSR